MKVAKEATGDNLFAALKRTASEFFFTQRLAGSMKSH